MKTTKKARYSIQILSHLQIRLVPEYVKGYARPNTLKRIVLDQGQGFEGVTFDDLKKRRWIDTTEVVGEINEGVDRY